MHCLVVIMMISGNCSQGLDNQLHSRIKFFLQSLQIQNPVIPLTVKEDSFSQCVDHVLRTAYKSLREFWNSFKIQVRTTEEGSTEACV